MQEGYLSEYQYEENIDQDGINTILRLGEDYSNMETDYPSLEPDYPTLEPDYTSPDGDFTSLTMDYSDLYPREDYNLNLADYHHSDYQGRLDYQLCDEDDYSQFIRNKDISSSSESESEESGGSDEENAANDPTMTSLLEKPAKISAGTESEGRRSSSGEAELGPEAEPGPVNSGHIQTVMEVKVF